MSTSDVRTRIESLLQAHPIVLFMKGTRSAPQCGFSAATVGVLDDLLPDYFSVNVLEDGEIREGIKAYGNWPTIPQLYVNGELVGGADIVQSMYSSGQLQSVFGLPSPDRSPPAITISDTAANAIRGALADAEPGVHLHMSIDKRFRAQFQLVQPDTQAIRAEAGGIAIYMNPGTAQRARGVNIDWVETPQGAGLKIDNPNAPVAVKSMSVQQLKARLDAADITLIDVRPSAERAQAALAQPFHTVDDGVENLAALPKQTALAFICHTGARSTGAAEHFRDLGFNEVYNVTGGIDAWSREIDASVPRY
ncbi:MAG: Grx4 family monothiol glutaredoxin [Rudaea sp.]